jgi:hypothetical protein
MERLIVRPEGRKITRHYLRGPESAGRAQRFIPNPVKTEVTAAAPVW